jgi:hypothetical protein
LTACFNSAAAKPCIAAAALVITGVTPRIAAHVTTINLLMIGPPPSSETASFQGDGFRIAAAEPELAEPGRYRANLSREAAERIREAACPMVEKPALFRAKARCD